MQTVIVIGSEGLIGKAVYEKLDPHTRLKVDPKCTRLWEKDIKFIQILLDHPTCFHPPYCIIDCSRPKEYTINHTIELYDNFLPLLSRGSSVVFLSSIYAEEVPHPEMYGGTGISPPSGEYAMWSAAKEQLTRYLAQKHKEDGIRFNCIRCGGVMEDRHKSGFARSYWWHNESSMINPEDVANVAAFLISEESKAINGQIITVDNGWSL